MSFRDLVDMVRRERSDAYVAISQAVADALVERGVPEDIITVIPNGIDADAFAEAAVEFYGDGAAKMPTADLKERPLVFCAARNMDQSKGIDVFAEAASLMLKDWPAEANIPAPNFRVAGSGPEKMVLEDFAKGEGIDDPFKVIGYAPLIAPWYKACDISVMPSRAEAAAVVALEAMSLGKPVVATRVGGIPEVVIDGETGILVDPDDPHELATAIRSLLLDPALAKRMGAAGALRVRNHFTEDHMVKAYIELFVRLTEGEGPA